MLGFGEWIHVLARDWTSHTRACHPTHRFQFLNTHTYTDQMPWRRSRVEWRPRVLLLLPLLLLPLHPAAAAEPISSSSGIRPRAAFWPSCRPSHPRAASSHSLRLQPLRCSSLDARVVAVERILDTHVFPERQAAADARKTLAFISQDRFLGRGEATTMPADSCARGCPVLCRLLAEGSLSLG